MKQIPTLLIGETGSGKTQLLARCRSLLPHGTMRVVDPLRSHRWTEPAWTPATRAGCRVVVFDHVSALRDAEHQVHEAADWCARHKAALWLVDRCHDAMPALPATLAKHVNRCQLVSFDRTLGVYRFQQDPLSAGGMPPESNLMPVMAQDFLLWAGIDRNTRR